MLKGKKPKVIAKAKAAAKVVTDPASLVKCEVNLDRGEWVSPQSCQVFYINEAALLPEIDFEIKTDFSGVCEWSWELEWVAKSCRLSDGKARFTPKGGVVRFIERGAFATESKKWRASFGGKAIGGEMSVTVKAGSVVFKRRIFILAKNPSQADVVAELERYLPRCEREVRLTKKIFKQESNYRQHYSDGMPLVSFDKGYGLGQATNPVPTYEQAWNWRKHVEYIVTSVLPDKISAAKRYLKSHPYSDEELDTEALVAYNGANRHYYVWGSVEKRWIVNAAVLCDPNESNKGWDVSVEDGKKKSLEDLRASDSAKPIYTGRCYAEHIKAAN